MSQVLEVCKNTNNVILTKGSHVFAGSDRLEPDEGNLHTRKSANRVPRGISDIKAASKSAH